jgi:hypothetical protein
VSAWLALPLTGLCFVLLGLVERRIRRASAGPPRCGGCRRDCSGKESDHVPEP